MIQYHLTKQQMDLFGENFCSIIRNLIKVTSSSLGVNNVTIHKLEDSFFQHKGTTKRNLIMYLSDYPEMKKYIRINWVGNYYFGIKVCKINFNEFFDYQTTKEKYGIQKYIFKYFLKNYFLSRTLRDDDFYYFEARFVGHKKNKDISLLLSSSTRMKLAENILKPFLTKDFFNIPDLFILIKTFLIIKNQIEVV